MTDINGDYGLTASIPGGGVADLIARLESAEAGSRELDARVCAAFCKEPGTYEIFPVTTSLDAALALRARVLSGWWTDVHVWPPRPVKYPIRTEIILDDEDASAIATLSYCHPKIPPVEVGWGDAATPALALCIAILKATHHGNEGVAVVNKNEGMLAGEWQPIETAPRDDVVLLFGRLDPLRLQGVKYGSLETPFRAAGYWGDIDGAWCTVGSTWEGPWMLPTHWMPLPPPPRPNPEAG